MTSDQNAPIIYEMTRPCVLCQFIMLIAALGEPYARSSVFQRSRKHFKINTKHLLLSNLGWVQAPIFQAWLLGLGNTSHGSFGISAFKPGCLGRPSNAVG